MFRCYETERRSAIWSSFILNLKKKILSSIHVDLNMSFYFVCLFFSKGQMDLCFYAIVSYTLFVPSTCCRARNISYFSYLLLTNNF